jgi:hypothetical protein
LHKCFVCNPYCYESYIVVLFVKHRACSGDGSASTESTLDMFMDKSNAKFVIISPGIDVHIGMGNRSPKRSLQLFFQKIPFHLVHNATISIS